MKTGESVHTEEMQFNSPKPEDSTYLLLEISEKAFQEIFTALGSTVSLDVLLKRILDFTIKECQADQGSIILIDKMSGDLEILSSRGLPQKIKNRSRENRKDGIAEWVIGNNKPLVLNDVERTRQYRSVAKDRKIRSAMCVPLRVKDTVIGTININRTRGINRYDDNHLNMALIMSTQAAVAIDNARLLEKSLANERLAAIGQTFAELGHCIKNVLTAMGGGAHILDIGINSRDFEKTAMGWEMVKRNNRFLKQLVLDMLSYSKEREPSYIDTDINRTCQSICGLYATDAAQKSVEIVFEADPAVGTAKLDVTAIKRCLANMVGNAVDACEGTGGRVVVATGMHDRPGWFTLRIQDNGSGISDADQQKLFQIFFSTKGAKGTGIGLPVSHKIISEHGGKIDVASKLGIGTTFTITLPLTPEDRKNTT